MDLLRVAATTRCPYTYVNPLHGVCLDRFASTVDRGSECEFQSEMPRVAFFKTVAFHSVEETYFKRKFPGPDTLRISALGVNNRLLSILHIEGVDAVD